MLLRLPGCRVAVSPPSEDVSDCPEGQHWDEALQACVPDESTTTWSPNTPPGTIVDANGSVTGYDGRMTAPQDQTEVVLADSVVGVPSGQAITCAVEAATDYDKKSVTSGGQTTHTYPQDGAVTYQWSARDASGATVGGFASPSSRTTTWTAPVTEGLYILRCKLDDPWTGTQTGVTAPEKGSKNDEHPQGGPPVVREVMVRVFEVDISVRSDKSSICAGAVASAPHQTTVTATVKDGGGNPMANQTVNFTVADSHPEYPCHLNPLTAQTDAAGEAKATLTSSRKIGATAIVKASCGDKSVETAPITMRPAASKRGYGILQFDQGYDKDTGWDFGLGGVGPQLFSSKDQTIAGTFSLKFQKDESEPPDKRYFTFNGAETDSIDQEPNTQGWISEWEFNNSAPRDALGLDSNWLAVNGHRIEIYIAEILDDAGNPVSSNASRYAYLVGANAAGRVSVTTNASGKAPFQLRSGPWIHRCSEIKLKAVDKTQVKAGLAMP